MYIKRKEYAEVVNYYEVEIDEKDIAALNAEILRNNPDFKALTEDEVGDYVRETYDWDRADEEIVIKESWQLNPFTCTLEEYMSEWVNDMLWSNGVVDTDTRQVYDSEDWTEKRKGSLYDC